MLKPAINELIDKTGSRYALVIAASKRARDILEGIDAEQYGDSSKPLSMAVQEIYDDKIEICKASEVPERVVEPVVEEEEEETV
ncbi:MAG: DNA-directed RNA polymerase subunit omega [Firmicutes bacterium]|jgi:DNA-directed RNA polymerase subunit omega|nr:DNA-directed RNA polymerase subunit omega [Bacillota bacterium]